MATCGVNMAVEQNHRTEQPRHIYATHAYRQKHDDELGCTVGSTREYAFVPCDESMCPFPAVLQLLRLLRSAEEDQVYKHHAWMRVCDIIL